ncbi:DUF397 domain-containing protein [Streptomyces spiramyceticus]|uniref:DUF397 domain-containing protein n=1 Tax=Streptomyces spiramyceticus TaxID=299717 RepID=UPI00237C06B2|nr:DUF397 domain-containing protein [Streptomyces spiramyceticus]
MGSDWQKSSYCAQGTNCVELARVRKGVSIREGEDPDVILGASAAALQVLIRGGQAGQVRGDVGNSTVVTNGPR